MTQRHLETRIIGVRGLIDRDNSFWKQTELNNTFLAIDRYFINNIPLNNLNEEDCLGWQPNKDRMYSVKLGFYMIRQWKRDQMEETSNK